MKCKKKECCYKWPVGEQPRINKKWQAIQVLGILSRYNKMEYNARLVTDLYTILGYNCDGRMQQLNATCKKKTKIKKS